MRCSPIGDGSGAGEALPDEARDDPTSDRLVFTATTKATVTKRIYRTPLTVYGTIGRPRDVIANTIVVVSVRASTAIFP